LDIEFINRIYTLQIKAPSATRAIAQILALGSNGLFAELFAMVICNICALFKHFAGSPFIATTYIDCYALLTGGYDLRRSKGG
jgi:hypothetical protein